MRYVCPICGYIYDEAAEGVPFDSLPDSWACPMCGAPKLMFEPEAAPEPPKPAAAPAAPAALDDDLQQLSAGALAALFRDDLDSGYPGLTAAAQAAGDRGTQRVCVWGEKVTRMLYTLLDRYQREGEAFLAGTQVWVCSVCGFVYIGGTPPAICPVCKVPAWKFDKIEGRRPA